MKVSEVAGRMVDVMMTVTAPTCGGDYRGKVATKTFPVVLRTRLIYEGRPMFLAADPVAEPEEVAS